MQGAAYVRLRVTVCRYATAWCQIKKGSLKIARSCTCPSDIYVCIAGVHLFLAGQRKEKKPEFEQKAFSNFTPSLIDLRRGEFIKTIVDNKGNPFLTESNIPVDSFFEHLLTIGTAVDKRVWEQYTDMWMWLTYACIECERRFRIVQGPLIAS